jgi:twinkle protein
MMAHPISTQAAEFFEGRGISSELVARMGIYTAKFVKIGDDVPAEIRPDANGNVIVFPYIEHDKVVNQKNRWRSQGTKHFSQTAGGRKTFWNADIMDDALLHRGDQALVITEGEIDALSAIEVGHPWSVSAPDGAPADVDAKGNPIPITPFAQIDPDQDKKFEYVVTNWDRLKKIKRIILATDDDGPGRRLRFELARRLGEARCWFVEYPDAAVVPDGEGGLRSCKDLNEVHLHLGADIARELIQFAKPYPVHGLFRMSEFPEQGKLALFSTGIRALDGHMKLYDAAFVVMSGLPGSGKSALANQIAFNMAALHRWHVTLASFEMPAKPYLQNQLRGFYIVKHRDDWLDYEIADADRFIDRHFGIIAAQNHSEAYAENDEPAATVDWLLEKAAEDVIRNGTRLVVVDPWNELEHKKLPGQARDEYVNEALRKFKAFCKRYGCAMIVVAHPTKTAAVTVQSGNPMTMYDISDGAAWANKAELGVIVTRTNTPSDVRDNSSMTRVDIRKVKFHESGQLGDVYVDFDTALRQFATGSN